MAHFARAAPGKKTDQIGIARHLAALRFQVFDHWMPDKNGAQT